MLSFVGPRPDPDRPGGCVTSPRNASPEGHRKRLARATVRGTVRGVRIAACIAILAASLAAPRAAEAARFALLIGNDAGQGTDVRLRYAESDTVHLAGVLSRFGDFAPSA